MIREDLVAERIAIDSYREMIRFVGDRDSTTRRMLEEVLATEEEHAEDLVSFIEEIEKWPPHFGPDGMTAGREKQKARASGPSFPCGTSRLRRRGARRRCRYRCSARRRPPARVAVVRVLLQPVVQRLQADAQRRRGALLVAAVVFERGEDQRALDVRERAANADRQVLPRLARTPRALSSSSHSSPIVLPTAITNARCTTLRNSRTLPGHS